MGRLGRNAVGSHLVFALAVGLAGGSLAGCGGPEKRPDPAPQPSTGASTGGEVHMKEPDPAAAPRALQHESLQGLVDAISAARSGGPAGTDPVQFTTVAAEAEKLAQDAGKILADAPGTLKDEERVRYEGMIATVKERAAGLRQAADKQDKLGVHRGYQQLTASCVKCHHQFGAPEGK